MRRPLVRITGMSNSAPLDESADAVHSPGQEQAPGNAGTRSAADRAVLFIGSLAYLGYVPFASGTVAVAVVGVPVHLLLNGWLHIRWPGFGAFVVLFTAFSIWIAGRCDRVIGEKDSKKNVIDELPGYFIAVFMLDVTWQIVVAAFFLERAIDIAKVWPARWIERHLPGGWGVVLDDVVAGFYTLILLHVAIRIAPAWLGAST
jgi:phosphatidylglycerophosphatase A